MLVVRWVHALNGAKDSASASYSAVPPTRKPDSYTGKKHQDPEVTIKALN